MLADGFCPHCFRSLWNGYSCKRRTCPGHVETYLRDWAEVVRAALAAWGGLTTLTTLTAPGAKFFPWDPTRCKLKGPHEHSGPNGCTVNPYVAAGWNETMNERLTRLFDAARERVRRAGLPCPEVLVHTAELKRGLFHVHTVLGFEPYQRQGLELFLDTLDELRGSYGFGTSKRGGFDRGTPGKFVGAHAGLYVSKYLRPGEAKGSFLPAIEVMEKVGLRDPETGRLRHNFRPVYVNRTLTARSKVTMSFLRFTRYAYKRFGPGLTRSECLLLWEFVKVFERSGGSGEPEAMPLPELALPPPVYVQDRLPF